MQIKMWFMLCCLLTAQKDMTKCTHTAVTVLNNEETLHRSHCEVTAVQAFTEARLRPNLVVHDHTLWFKVTIVSAVESVNAAGHLCDPQRQSWRYSRPWDSSVDTDAILYVYKKGCRVLFTLKHVSETLNASSCSNSWIFFMQSNSDFMALMCMSLQTSGDDSVPTSHNLIFFQPFRWVTSPSAVLFQTPLQGPKWLLIYTLWLPGANHCMLVTLCYGYHEP